MGIKRHHIAEAFTDLTGLAGAGLSSWGFWQIYQPAGYIVGGALLMTGAWLAARGAAPPAPTEQTE